MRATSVLFLLAGAVVAVSATPIGRVAMVGDGTYSYGWGDGTAVFQTASNFADLAEDRVSFNISTFWAGGYVIVPGSTARDGVGGARYSSGSATIGLVSSQYFSVFLGDGGSLVLYDGVDGNEISSVLLDAYQTVTSQTNTYFTGAPLLLSSTGTMSIVHNPEPGSWVLMLTGVLLMVAKGRRAYNRRRN
jgi:hypothetical protein